MSEADFPTESDEHPRGGTTKNTAGFKNIDEMEARGVENQGHSGLNTDPTQEEEIWSKLGQPQGQEERLTALEIWLKDVQNRQQKFEMQQERMDQMISDLIQIDNRIEELPTMEQHVDLSERVEKLEIKIEEMSSQSDIESMSIQNQDNIEEIMSDLDEIKNLMDKNITENKHERLSARVDELELKNSEEFPNYAEVDSIADYKINSRLVKPIFLFISMLTAIGAISALLIGPLIIGVVLTVVTIATWYLLWLDRDD